jgi:hypothetical protein
MALSGDYKLKPGMEKTLVIGFNAGVNVSISLAPNMGLVAGWNYETRGMKITERDINLTAKVTANYLQVPILFSYKFMPELAVNIGPEVGIFICGKETITMDSKSTETAMTHVSTLDLGASVQVTYTVANMIVVGAGYYYGFLNTDSANHDPAMSGAATNNTIKIFVGYLIHL